MDENLTKFQRELLEDIKRGYRRGGFGVRRFMSAGHVSPWDFSGASERRAANELVRKGYLKVDQAGWYLIIEKHP